MVVIGIFTLDDILTVIGIMGLWSILRTACCLCYVVLMLGQLDLYSRRRRINCDKLAL